MEDSEDFYDGLLEGLFWFFWPKGWGQWLLYFGLVIGFTVLKSRAHERAHRVKPETAVSPVTEGADAAPAAGEAMN